LLLPVAVRRAWSSPRHRDQPPGIDFEFLRGFLDCLVRVDRLDAADDLGPVGSAIDVPGDWLGASGFFAMSVVSAGRYVGSIV
jgi:hypothetical protein